ncbi:2-deoxy-D-gluconate 3-dehydrogenase [Pseudoroseomonas deserti]|uniref:2-deoxy-D-gluconate 3-dehydrogenase n=1 Tax=Teichococcus deserti TaxID=1817963 RepID=A0A1V2GV62_9PROT|nr:SDR family oxidoreductase [Pseudoroseomonas deserti]ONG46214.1 2-deoxy-D-gluconate 3-dehydrogenase [Pseudoroseomonas deserti]
MFDLTGRVALVTGGNGGIGLGMARGLAAAGARIAVVGRNADKNAAAVAELGGDSFSVVADLTAIEAPARALGAVLERTDGKLDILVNNAGTNIRRLPQEVTDEDWATVLDTNLTSVMRLTRAAYPQLKASGHGRVICIGSMMSIFGLPLSPAYGASKGAIVQYVRSLAVAWGQDGITVNALLPGWIETELTAGAKRDIPTLNDSVLARTPQRRWGQPGDFAGIAAFLASDASAFVTGTAIPVDGGLSVHG